MDKSGSPKKRLTARQSAIAERERKLGRKLKNARAETDTVRRNAGLLLRAIAYLINKPATVDGGRAEIPLTALAQDVAIDVHTTDTHLVFAAAPEAPSEMSDDEVIRRVAETPYMTRDMLLLASRFARIETIRSWPPVQQAQAFEWAAREHIHASDNPSKRLPMPAWVAVLPQVIANEDGFYRIRYADGSEDTIEKERA